MQDMNPTTGYQSCNRPTELRHNSPGHEDGEEITTVQRIATHYFSPVIRRCVLYCILLICPYILHPWTVTKWGDKYGGWALYLSECRPGFDEDELPSKSSITRVKYLQLSRLHKESDLY